MTYVYDLGEPEYLICEVVTVALEGSPSHYWYEYYIERDTGNSTAGGRNSESQLDTLESEDQILLGKLYRDQTRRYELEDELFDILHNDKWELQPAGDGPGETITFQMD